MLPFTIDQFLTVFEQYNQAIWPMHVLAYLLGIGVILCVVKKARYADQVISVALALHDRDAVARHRACALSYEHVGVLEG